MPRALPVAAALAALAQLAAGCARELELPPRSTAPVLAALSPSAAYAGQLVRLQGSGLDPDPSANVVTFAAATARGLRFEGAALVVRVPDDAGSGPVIVANGRGTSAPSGDFAYLGLGEPRRRAPTAGLPLLHAPRAVHGIGGSAYLDSAIYDGLLSSADGGFSTPAADLSAAADWKGALYGAAHVPQTTTATLWRVDATTGAAVGPRTIPFPPTALVPMRGVDLLVAFSASGATVAAWDLDTLEPVLAATLVAGAEEWFAATDVRDGRAVAVAYGATYDLTLALVDFAGVRAGGAPAATLLPGAFDPPLDLRVAVALADRAGPDVSAGEPLAAITLAGGDLAVARLGPDPRFVGTIETFSPSDVAALAGAATIPVVVATKPDDGLAVGADLVARELVWAVEGDLPGAAGAAGDVALVAHGGNNLVSVVNLVDGARIARLSFDLAPGRGEAASYAGGLAYLGRDPAVSGSEDLLFLVSSRFPGLLRFSLDARTATCSLRAPGIGPVAASAGEPALWVARRGVPAALDLLRDRGAAAPVTVTLPGLEAVPLLAPRGTDVAFTHRELIPEGVVGGGAGLSLLDAAGLSSVATVGLGAVGLGFAPDGRIWIVPRLGPAATAQLWEPAQVHAGGAPAAQRPLAAGAWLSAAWLEDGLWILGRGDVPSAVLLGPELDVVRTVRLAGDAPAGAIASPNGRLLVERVFGGPAGQTVLHFYRADPDVGFPLLDTLVVEGVVEGLTFEPSGERLWLVTRDPDALVLVD